MSYFFSSFLLKNVFAGYACNADCSLNVNGCNTPLTCYAAAGSLCRESTCLTETDCLCAPTPTLPAGGAGGNGCPDSGTISSSCSFALGVNGVDVGSGSSNTGQITIQAGQTLTIMGTQTIATSKINLTPTSATVLFDGGKIIIGHSLWLLDNDNDGYPANTTMVASTSAPGAGYKRKNTLTEWWYADSNDSDPLLFN